jgi:magnesium-transporting ATPase (P-type)
VLAIVVFLTGLVTYFQNAQSESIMEAIAKNRPKKAMVMRNGVKVEINPDDVIYLY